MREDFSLCQGEAPQACWRQVKGIQRRHSEKDAAELSIFGLRIVLHCETALEWLAGAGSSSGAGSRRDALPCTTFQQFLESSKPTLPSPSSSAEKSGGDDAIDLLIDKAVIDGERIKVVFKAGVEV